MHRPLTTIALLFVLLLVSPGRAEEEKPAWHASPKQQVLVDRLDISVWKTDEGLASILTLPKGAGNAATHYAALDTLYEKERNPATRLVLPDATGIDEILKASAIRACSFVPSAYPARTEPNAKGPNLLACLAYMKALLKRAEALEGAGDAAGAERLVTALIVWGWHLTEDRPTYEIFRLGLTLQQHGCEAYQKFLVRQVQTRKAREVSTYADAIRRFSWLADFKKKYVLESWEGFVSLGAVIRCAMEDQEPMWRQEACLGLWVLQNGYPMEGKGLVTDPRQQEAARRALDTVAQKDADPALRKLAAWCRSHPEAAVRGVQAATAAKDGDAPAPAAP